MPANAVIAAMTRASGRASMREAAHAPTTLKITAPAQTGRVIRQSIEPRRWKRSVPRIPVKRKLKSEVAAAWWMVRPENKARQETISTPPTPTVPMSRPTKAASAARRMSGISRRRRPRARW